MIVGSIAYGESTYENGDHPEDAIFTSKEIDPVTGLYYFNARWYDPAMGRFITEDPIKDGNNWHTYCSNNPINFIDPTGLKNTQEGMNDAGYDKNKDQYAPSYDNYMNSKENNSKGSEKIVKQHWFLEPADLRPPPPGIDPPATNPDYDPDAPCANDGDYKYSHPPSFTLYKSRSNSPNKRYNY